MVSYLHQEVKNSLALLVQHNLVTFSDKRKPGLADYQISKQNIINLLFYPFYTNLICGEQEVSMPLFLYANAILLLIL